MSYNITNVRVAMRKTICILAIICSILLAVAVCWKKAFTPARPTIHVKQGQPIEYTASWVDMLIVSSKSPIKRNVYVKSKVYVKGDRVRVDDGHMNFVYITRWDIGKSYVLYPFNMTYQIIPITDKQGIGHKYYKFGVARFSGGSVAGKKPSAKEVPDGVLCDEEVINGVLCDKYVLKFSRDTTTCYVSEELYTLIKSEYKKSPSISVRCLSMKPPFITISCKGTERSGGELTDIKLEPVSDSLFELPPGYKYKKRP